MEQLISLFKGEIEKLNNNIEKQNNNMELQNGNIIKLLERDKVQNKRINDIEEEQKEQRKDFKKINEFMIKIGTILSIIGFLSPILVRILWK